MASAKNQALENKAVNKTAHSVEQTKKKGW
jgi:hypothetical protein